MKAAKEAYEATVRGHRLESAKLREDSEGLRAQAEQVDVLMARCARLEVGCGLISRRCLYSLMSWCHVLCCGQVYRNSTYSH